MEIKDLKTLIKLVTETDITEFEMENSEEKIVIKRGPSHEVVYAQAPAMFQAPAATASQPMPAMASPVVTDTGASSAAVNDKLQTINSPMVGTFYRKPSPEAESFVEVGSVVDAGATVCLIEAMKMFNEIEAEFKCKIIEILKNDTEPVEYGDPLFIVEPL
jgi:acetyl-CoA carboxylase biotin carboxyl carrier protein